MKFEFEQLYKTISFMVAIVILLTPIAKTQTTTDFMERWGVFEIKLTDTASANPYLNVKLSATFTQGDQRYIVPGFWEGGDTYKVRFSPPTTGEWRFETHSVVPELNGKTGVFRATEPTSDNHGPIEIFNTYYLRYADGTPYHQFGTTCYAWVHQTPELQEQTLKTLAASPFNKIRFCVFPKSYVYNENEPEFYAFKKGAENKFDFSQPDPAFWQHFEKQILELQRLGIEADLILWHPYDRWGFADMSDEEDDRYLRYCIARLSAYRNVWWSLANEYDFMTNRPQGHRGNKQWEDWDRFFSILEKEDPHQRLRGIHNGRRWYDHTKEWVTHASLQTSDMEGGVGYREQYGKPVVYDECRYEGDIPQGWGNITAQEMTQRFWLGTMSGCYVGHGETYKHPDDILWWAKGGILYGQSPKRIQWLKDFMAGAPAFYELQPIGDEKSRFVLAKPGEYYLLYCPAGRFQSIQLAGSTPYKVDAIDPWEMTESPVGTARPGEFKTSAPDNDIVYRFIPYSSGEKLRPEARIQTSVTEGFAPLTVKFDSESPHSVLWEFGDGSTATEPAPSHTFEKPGLYRVALTVTDADGATARNHILIAVDRTSVSEPIVLADFSDNEKPGLRLQGTAKRTADGGLHLPDGAPWGRAEADTVTDDLRGLRSFTILGWLKPENLEIGSGGNRIIFCLNGARAGIDLVCHEDGRLRLAVNQWPDGVNNDSSPGVIQVGKWTFFAVTYNATESVDNVSWYFSEPIDTPKLIDVTLDCKTTYNVGSVDSDIGPLAIGNFNKTMGNHGWDRQFRGEIRGIQIFGSRVGGRGALKAKEIKSRLQ
ncbi:DUF5060 domain-containing protein [candidate division KSB1 bacterium]|nr:DUF5060 domain-containing protein [candidate division KSB1 bacterium]